jgi:hypothetical protein
VALIQWTGQIQLLVQVQNDKCYVPPLKATPATASDVLALLV